MIKWLKSIATYAIVIVLSFGVGFGICWLVKNCAKDIIEIDLTESQKQQIVQDARLGRITLDSAKALIVSESKIKWITDYKDSLVIKDSLNIRDSIIYIPVYTARDTTIEFNDTSEVAIVSLAIKLKQRFFPLQERFASELKLMSLTVEIPEAKEPGGWFSNFFEHRFIIYVGGGLNYYDKQVQLGIQLGAGIRIY